MEGQLSLGRMLEPEQQKEDILVGGVPGLRNRGPNKVRKSYTWRRRGGLGQGRVSKVSL